MGSRTKTGSVESNVPDRMTVLREDLTSTVEIDICELADIMYLSARGELKKHIDKSGIGGNIDRFPPLPDTDTIKAELYQFFTEEFNKVRLDALTNRLGFTTNTLKSNGMFSDLWNLTLKLIPKGKRFLGGRKNTYPTIGQGA